MTAPRDDATQTQILAATPQSSTWLEANAGSGKTRVLTDRVARLLLRGVPPQRILCLTYTRAAATEMQNRLFRRLGAWAMAEDATLQQALDDLGVDPADNTPEVLRSARTLFARAIETPGGLKLQTIHSFCAALLRRFPLEAGVSPGFVEMDDRSAELLQADLLDQLAGGPDQPIFDDMARLLGGGGLQQLTKAVIGARASFDPVQDRAGLAAKLGLPADLTLEALAQQTFGPGDCALLAALRTLLLTRGGNDLKAGQKLCALDLDHPSTDWFAVLEGVLLFGAGAKAPFAAKVDAFPTKDGREAFADHIDDLNDLMMRVEGARQTRLAVQALDRSTALHAFAGWLLPAYAQAKQDRGWLDFDDLILKARALLSDSGVAQWVLFRLDGGIDHILVDEAQDTSPVQWDIIRDLAREFATGQGARADVQRTIFVVGDPKQSIYSFQGADPDGFGRMRDYFETALTAAQEPFQTRSLKFSFRSASAILQVVDETFAALGHQGLGGDSAHAAFHGAMPGRVDLWPLIEKTETPEPLPFDSPVDALPETDHRLRLARQVVDEMVRLIAQGTQITTSDGTTRPVTAGDFLILVQRRSDIFHEIIRACKDRGLPVAGADRLRIGGELAVRDLMALLRFAALPEDDLSLATVLRSPLCNWTEAQLFKVASGRAGLPLWAAIRDRADVPTETLGLLRDCLEQADFLRPFDLIDRVLTRHDGRANLLARLGAEAEDGIDALLAQALTYEQGNVPSLTGFVGWMSQDTSDLRRALDQQGDRVRVMTVHGAKGLESPIVILPDCGARKPPGGGNLIRLADGTVLWRGAKSDATPEIAQAMDAAATRDAEERLRLLYVAMTRAESWLIVAAAGDTDDASWYEAVRTGLERRGAARMPGPDTGETLRFETGDWPAPLGRPAQPPAAPGAPAPLPDWMRDHAARPTDPSPSLSPSDLGGAKVAGFDEDALDQDAAKARGTALHWLLEHLPGQPPARWAHLATLGPAGCTDLLDDARAVLTAPDLAPYFGPDGLAEVSITADLPGLGGRRILGQIDRLLVGPDHVTAIDFKSNAAVPDRAEDVPEGLLRQMAAYHEALCQLYPAHDVRCAILWTKTARLMPLDPAHLRAALARWTPS